jgi:hypothetical protein
MPYTNKSLALVWFVACTLFVIVGSGEVTRTWLLVLVLVALSAPAVLLRGRAPALTVAPIPPRHA